MSTALKACGDWLCHHQNMVRWLQWGMVGLYLVLLLGPVLPFSGAADLGRWAQVVFWGVWWPGVLLSMMLLGQVWCGLLCPDGAVSEALSRHGRGSKPAAWMRPGWLPVVLFAALGLLTDATRAHESPWGVVLAVGGASVAALAVGAVHGRGKRVWCRFLCPLAGVFSLLARCSPLYFQVDRDRWDSAPKPQPKPVDCPLLLDVRRLRGTEKCNMCARCSGHRGAVQLAWRWPGAEIAEMTLADARLWEALAICFVLLGLAPAGAAARGDLAVILGLGVAVGAIAWMALLAGARTRQGAALLAYALLPLGGAGLVLAALSHAVPILVDAGISVPIVLIRAAGISVAVLWSLRLGWISTARLAGGSALLWRARLGLGLLSVCLAAGHVLAPLWLF